MALEWVAPVGTVLVAAVGSITTILVSRRGQEHAEKLTRINADQAKELAQISAEQAAEQALVERVHRQRHDAYIEVLTTAGKVAQSVAITERAVKFADEPAPPRMPTFDEQNRARALVMAYASPEVGALYDALFERIRDFERSLMDLAQAREAWKDGDRSGKSPVAVHGEDVEGTARPAVHKAYLALGERIQTELA